MPSVRRVKRPRFALNRGLTAIGLLVAAGAVAGLALGWLGRFHPVADIASHATCHLIGTLIGATLGVIACRAGRTALAVTLVAVCAVSTLAIPSWLASQAIWSLEDRTTPPTDGNIRIVSLNAWHSNRDVDALERFLESVAADIIVLTEFGPAKSALAKRLANKFPHQAGCSDNIWCAMHLLSRHPIMRSQTTSRHNGTGPPTVEVQFGAALRNLSVIGVHLMRPIDSRWGSYNEVTQIAARVRALSKSAGAPVIVAGDFNLTPWSWNWRKFRDESGLKNAGPAWPALSPASWPAAPLVAPQLAIDHVFVSDELSVTRIGLGPVVGSDHLPVIADIAGLKSVSR